MALLYVQLISRDPLCGGSLTQPEATKANGLFKFYIVILNLQAARVWVSECMSKATFENTQKLDTTLSHLKNKCTYAPALAYNFRGIMG